VASQKLNDRFWLAEELSEDHWLNVNKDTKADTPIPIKNTLHWPILLNHYTKINVTVLILKNPSGFSSVK